MLTQVWSIGRAKTENIRAISCFRSPRPGLLQTQAPLQVSGWCLGQECFLWAALKALSLPVSWVAQLIPVETLCRCTLVDVSPFSCSERSLCDCMGTAGVSTEPCSSRTRLTDACFKFEDVICNNLKKEEEKNSDRVSRKAKRSVWACNLNWLPQIYFKNKVVLYVY